MMRFKKMLSIGVVTATAVLAMTTRSEAQDVMQLAAACDAGNMQACNALMRVARSACLNGDSNGCAVAAQLAELGVSGSSSEGYPTDYYDPLAPYRDTLRDTNGYINSYCSDPKIAAQLRAFNYCH